MVQVRDTVCSSSHVCSAQYHEYLECVRQDDVNGLHCYLHGLESAEKEKLSNSHFAYETDLLAGQTEVSHLHHITLPLAVAVALKASSCVELLMKEGTFNLLQTDCEGNNIIHNLVVMVEYEQELEEYVVDTYKSLMSLAGQDAIRELLGRENRSGLRPIEFAAQHGQCGLFLAIMNTPPVYLFKEELSGVVAMKYYDVTDYESFDEQSRAAKSPLMLMTFMDKRTSCSKYFSEFSRSPFVSLWQRHKFITAMPLILVWFFWRLLVFINFVVLDLDTSWIGTNGTQCKPSNYIYLTSNDKLLITTFLVVSSGITICCDIFETALMFTKKQNPIWNTIRGRKSILCQVHFYRYSHFLFACVIILKSPAIYVRSDMDIATLMDALTVVSPCLAVQSMLYFVQLLPSIGFFILCIHKMGGELVNFLIVFLLLLLPFVQSFYIYLNFNTLQGCIAGFDGYAESIYSVFTMMLNMISLLSLDVKQKVFLYATHMIFIFIVAIMLVNFFIAIMSGAIGGAMEHRDLAVSLQRSTVGYLLERRWAWLLQGYFRYMGRRRLVMKAGRLLVVDTRLSVRT